MAKTKKEINGASALSLAEAFRCGECLHFKKHKHRAHENLCSEEGIRAMALAPKCYTPDVSRLLKNSDTFVQLTMLFDNYSPKEKRILLGVLRAASKTKKKQYRFGTRLYLLLGRDYLSNYVCGYVMGYSSTGELLLSGSPDPKMRGSSFLSISESTMGFMTHSEWLDKRQKLIQTGKVYDPTKGVTKVHTAETHVPPTIDNVDPSWYDRKGPLRRRKRTDAVDQGMTFTFNH